MSSLCSQRSDLSCSARIKALISGDSYRLRALQALQSLDLPQGLISAGFVRNAIWDDQFARKTALNDIDVIYYCTTDNSEQRDRLYEQELATLAPEFPWSVKNQARMHHFNGDAPYRNVLDAMACWPELQTAIGIKLDSGNQLSLQHCFDLALQFNRQINPNPIRSLPIFEARVAAKGWLDIWPGLVVKY